MQLFVLSIFGCVFSQNLSLRRTEREGNLHQIIYYSENGEKNIEKYAPANINFYLSGTFFRGLWNYVVHSNQTLRKMHQHEKTNDPEAEYAITINSVPFAFFGCFQLARPAFISPPIF